MPLRQDCVLPQSCAERGPLTGHMPLMLLGCAMSFEAISLYRSPNGDRWSLMRDSESTHRFVRHEANPSSGGHITDVALDDFLSMGGSGPEFAALHRLLDAEANNAAT